MNRFVGAHVEYVAMMNPAAAFGMGLGNLPLVSDAETRSICAENPDGAVGGGARAVPDDKHPGRTLGKGWKSRACIFPEPGETVTLADIAGSGVIQHIWITVDPRRLREVMLRFYWDGEDTPSIEVPLGDFFACGHAQWAKVNSWPIAVNPSSGLNSYWPMPFRKHARITVENVHSEKIEGFFYQITYAKTDVPDEAAYLHGQWRRSLTTRAQPEHTILADVTGQGHYVGTVLAWTQLSNGWWGEGEVKFFIDDDDEYPTICGTGTEDYVGGAWGFYASNAREEPYSTPFLGLPLVRHADNEVPKHTMYRWHILDPIRFRKALRVTVQALGWWPDGRYQPLTDDIASTALWYQVEPHGKFPAAPTREALWPR
jgi:hypothetical protein